MVFAVIWRKVTEKMLKRKTIACFLGYFYTSAVLRPALVSMPRRRRRPGLCRLCAAMRECSLRVCRPACFSHASVQVNRWLVAFPAPRFPLPTPRNCKSYSQNTPCRSAFVLKKKNFVRRIGLNFRFWQVVDSEGVSVDGAVFCPLWHCNLWQIGRQFMADCSAIFHKLLREKRLLAAQFAVNYIQKAGLRGPGLPFSTPKPPFSFAGMHKNTAGNLSR